MQQINLLLASLPDGILLGFVYGVAAMGLTLIWGVMNVINLSHGPIIALGMFGTYLIFNKLGINPYLGLFLVPRSDVCQAKWLNPGLHSPY